MANAQVDNRVVKALIVDDQPIIRKMHRRMLVDFGFEVAEVEDGKAAVNYFLEGNEPELVLIDKQMPEMDGVEATRILRGMGVQTKIVAVTGETSSNGEFLDAGANGFMTKPMQHAKLAEFLKAFDLLS